MSVGGRGPAGQAVEAGDRFDEADEAIEPRAVFRGLTGAEEAVCPCVIVERIETVIEIELTRDIGSLRVEIVAEGREVLVDHAHLAHQRTLQHADILCIVWRTAFGRAAVQREPGTVGQRLQLAMVIDHGLSHAGDVPYPCVDASLFIGERRRRWRAER